MIKITYYNFNGEIEREDILNENTIKQFHGMKVKCVLIDESECVGFANSFYSFEKGDTIYNKDLIKNKYITLETFVNLDENTHTFIDKGPNTYDVYRETVQISLISHIDVILYSGLRWGCIPTNKFILKL